MGFGLRLSCVCVADGLRCDLVLGLRWVCLRGGLLIPAVGG